MPSSASIASSSWMGEYWKNWKKTGADRPVYHHMIRCGCDMETSAWDGWLMMTEDCTLRWILPSLKLLFFCLLLPFFFVFRWRAMILLLFCVKGTVAAQW
eukprot:11332244-Ditylum_brightwellii.AAC.1